MSIWVTRIGLAILAVILIGWDIYLATNSQTGDTISEVVQFWSMRHPIFAYAYGILGGHFFWPGPSFVTVHTTGWQNLGIILCTGVIVVILDLIHLKTGWFAISFVERWPVVIMLVAVPIGHIFWAQARQIT